MKIFNPFNKENNEKEVFTSKKKGKTFTNQERIKAQITRNTNAMFKRTIKQKQNELLLLDLELQKQQRLNELEEISNGGYENETNFVENDDKNETIEEKLLNLVTNAFNHNQNNKQNMQKVDKDYKKIVEMIPLNIRNQLKVKPVDEIKQMAKLHYPDISEEDIEKIIPLL